MGDVGEGEAQSVHQLVVVGASAGGVEALSALVSTLPTSFSAPIIVAQHLDPSRLSHLQEIVWAAFQILGDGTVPAVVARLTKLPEVAVPETSEFVDVNT